MFFKTPDEGDNNAANEKTEQAHTGGYGGKPESAAIKMKGLPYSVTKEDITKFFDGYGLVESSVKIGEM